MKRENLVALSAFWFAWELHWAALLGAAMQGQIARFAPADLIGTATAVLAGSGAAFSILAQYGAGVASDRAGRRLPFVIVGTLFDIAALFGFALSPSFVAVVITFAGVQISLNVACGPYQALMPDRVSLNARGRASAVMGLFRLAGTAAGLVAAKIFVHQPGPHVGAATFEGGLVRLAALVAGVLILALIVTVAGVGEAAASATRGVQHQPVDWSNKASFTWLIASRAAVNMGLYSILPFLAFYLRFAQHVSAYLARSLDLLLVMIVCALAGTLPAGIAGDRMPKKRIIYAALTLLAVGAAAMSLLQTQSWLFEIAIILGLGWGAYYSVDWALACMLLPEGRAGALMAIWNIGASAPQVAAPVVAGLVLDRVNAATHALGLGYRVVFAMVALFMVVGQALLAFVREPRAGVPERSG